MDRKAINIKLLYGKLNTLYDLSPTYPLSKNAKWVIFSDLHMGDGGSMDDFRRNSKLFIQVLRAYYLKNEHALILNGDVEELQRFPIEKVVRKWGDVYQLFDEFDREEKLYKLVGNHDIKLLLMKGLSFGYKHLEGMKLQFDTSKYLFIFHGHQASRKYQEHNNLVGFILKYFANPLGIRSYSVSHSSKKQYNIEKRVYSYSAFNKIVSVIGHTHRPLFESLHKYERLKYKIEQLCRDYTEATSSRLNKIEIRLKSHKRELKKYYRECQHHNHQNHIYNTLFHVPCLFNSGCVVGKRGITCLEIEEDKIRLVHWFDGNISKKYLIHNGYKPQQLENTNFYRMVIDEEFLYYIFTKVNLLA